MSPEEAGRQADPQDRDEPFPEDPASQDLVPEDDRIIGQALRWSLLVIGLLLALGGGILWLLNRPPEVGPEKQIQASAPVDTLDRPADPPEVRFTDVTREVGIDFVHYNGARGEKLLPETMGGGAAFVDLDGDLDQDLVFVNGTDWPHTRNPSEHFPTVTVYWNEGARYRRGEGPEADFYGMGVSAADYDADGDQDLFVTAVGPNHLFENRDGQLVDVTGTAGVAGAPDDWSTASAWLDHDNDGDLDLFVGNYVQWSKEIDFELDYRLTGVGRAYGPPLNYRGTFPYLYRNEGDGTFTDVSAEVGIQVENPATGVPVAKTLAVAPVDVDRDGWIDLMVANDTVQNFFFHNQGDGTFVEAGELYGLAYDRDGSATGAMGVDTGDFRNDGSQGFLIGNFANEMTSLYVSQGDPTLYADEAIPEGVGAATRRALSFGLFLFDYDLDGRLDLLQNNGHLEEEIASVDPSQSYRQHPQLFWNAGPSSRNTFVPVAPTVENGLDVELVGRGATFADFDGDGDLDPLLLQTGAPPVLLRNDQQLGHAWTRIRLEGGGENPNALGAWIDLTANGITQRRPVMPVRSYLSQVELPVTFGLG
ncbi:MAG: CRTAC1 family protein, partial [Thermoanaerobaculia bacterium]|nr:CRTAC1 family protein [Thermoanaerobaculia bacterium]